MKEKTEKKTEKKKKETAEVSLAILMQLLYVEIIY
jgi:hypothetical protein